jgi:DNA polymerase I-like protein with 3'-5' exonuclease and polymerase domains
MYERADVRECIENALDRYHIVAHNGKFDQNVMASRVATFFSIDDDTMLMHYSLFELGKHGLKELATEYLGATDYEEDLIISWFREQGIAEADRRYSLVPRDRLYKYAAIDGAVTLQLWRIFDAELRAKKLYEWPYRNVLLKTANALPTIEQTGIPIDRAQMLRNKLDFEAELTILNDKMNEIVLPRIQARENWTTRELLRLMTKRVKVSDGEPRINAKGKSVRGKAVYEDRIQYNPKSNQQTHYILYDILGLKLNKRLIKPTSTNTGKEALEALPDHPFVATLRHHRRIAKMTDTYISSAERRATIDNLIHVDFRITGTEIGRLSASAGDHGIPRPDDYYGAAIRSMFVAANDDEVLIIADYSQAELRAFAHLAQVKFLIDKYRAGEDVHTETALMLEKYGAAIFQGFAASLHAS